MATIGYCSKNCFRRDIKHMNRILRSFLKRISPSAQGRVARHGTATRTTPAALDALVQQHFCTLSEEHHPCRPTLHHALALLQGKPAVILETGSSAWGTNSSMLMDAYVNSFGGAFHSVDTRLEPMFSLRQTCTSRSQFHCDDSVAFLKKFLATPPQAPSGRHFDLIYLDSWDVNWRDLLPSALHGLHEFLSILPALKPGTLMLVDDTPKDAGVMTRVQPRQLKEFNDFVQAYGFAPGKGALIKDYLVRHGLGQEIAHDYQLLWQF